LLLPILAKIERKYAKADLSNLAAIWVQ